VPPLVVGLLPSPLVLVMPLSFMCAPVKPCGWLLPVLRLDK
jgi:hypothetical protein